MELEEAKRKLNELATFYDVKVEEGDIAIDIVLKELDKKDKIINLMAKNIRVVEDDKEKHLFNPEYHPEYIIEYFYKQVEVEDEQGR